MASEPDDLGAVCGANWLSGVYAPYCRILWSDLGSTSAATVEHGRDAVGSRTEAALSGMVSSSGDWSPALCASLAAGSQRFGGRAELEESTGAEENPGVKQQSGGR